MNTRWVNNIFYRKYAVVAIIFIGGLLLVSLLFFSKAQASSTIIHVNHTAGNGGNGQSWETAYNSLQEALSSANLGDEIWVAKGVYTPGQLRFDAFVLVEGVSIYGGFAATETVRTDRDWERNITVLSGDINGDDITDPNGIITDTSNIVGLNNLHVVKSLNIQNSTTLDGFTITAGQADNSAPDNRGGGAVNISSQTSFSNISFVGNTALEGGGIYNSNSTSDFENVLFYRNFASVSNGVYGGGGMFNDAGSNLTIYRGIFLENSSPSDAGGVFNLSSTTTITNTVFLGNSAGEGGGIFNYNGSQSLLTNVLFSGNSAGNGGAIINSIDSSGEWVNVAFASNTAIVYGGGVFNKSNSNPNFYNVILWENDALDSGDQIYNSSATPTISNSLIQDGCPTGSVCVTTPINQDPVFVRNPNSGDGSWTTLDDNDYGDLRLKSSSPAIDQGDNSFVIVGFDLDEKARIIGLGVDLGPYESLLEIYLPLLYNE